MPTARVADWPANWNPFGELTGTWQSPPSTCGNSHCLPVTAAQPTETPPTQRLQEAFTAADAVVFAVPIYNYDINAAAKNAIELAGRQLTGKVAGFLCAAGGEHMKILLGGA